MTELKPCPFCGGEAAVIKHTFIGYGEDYYQTVCLDCNTSNADFRYRTEEHAINAWNKRASDKTSDKYRWHDLRKNPNDLPCDMDNVQICWIGGSNNWYDSMFWDADRKVFSINGKTEFEVIHPVIGDNRYVAYGEAIAWREIEPFEVIP